MTPAAWRRNLFAVTAASFIGFTGFTLVMPFLPLYFQDLGVTEVGALALWTGVSLGVTPAMTAVLSPLWGRLADRFGRKIMVERSLVSFVVVMTAMAFATKPWHVLALRILQGFFAGYGALALTMAADSAPPGRLAASIGTVQTAQRLGPALGPVIGGVLAGAFGLRRAFAVAAAFYAAGFLLVLFAYREPPIARAPSSTDGRPPPRTTWRDIVGIDGVPLVLAAIFTLQYADRSLGPILPLYLTTLGVPLSRAPFLSGLLFSTTAGSGAAGNAVCPRLLKRWSARRVLCGCAVTGVVATLLLALRPPVWLVFVANAAFGAAIGTGMTASYTAGASALPAHARGTGFGYFASASLVALAMAPVAAGLLSALDIRAVFAADAIALGVVGAFVARRMPERAAERAEAHPDPPVAQG